MATILQSIPKIVVEEYLPKMFSSYSELNGDDEVSSWIVWSNETDKVKIQLNEVCHAKLWSHDPGFTDLITAVPVADEVSLAYLRMLIHGPFKAMGDLISLEQQGEYHYLHCSDLDKWPANVLYNFCIASRVPIEHEYLLAGWHTLCKQGYDQVLAFLLSYSYGGNLKAKKRDFPNLCHFWFDPSSNWKCILSGSCDTSEVSFKKNPKRSIPCNVIWGKDPDAYRMSAKSNQQISDLHGLAVEVLKIPEKPKKAIKPVKIQHQHILEQVNWQPLAAAAWPQNPGANAAEWAQAIIANPAGEIALHLPQQQPQPEIGPHADWNWDNDPDFN